MSRFWLTYRFRNRLSGVIIVDSSSLIAARMGAAIDGLDVGAEFCEGRKLDRAAAAGVPAAAIGRMLRPDQAVELIRRNLTLAKRQRRAVLQSSAGRGGAA
jgi:hypothetical protein